MVEAFIYLHVVGKDRSNRRAEGLLCHVHRQKEAFYRDNPMYDFAGGLLRLANKQLAELTRSEDTVPLRKVKWEPTTTVPNWDSGTNRSTVAHASRPTSRCSRVHGPFLFREDPKITIGNVVGALFRVATATDQALQLMLNLAAFVSDNVIGIRLDVDDLGERALAIRSEPITSETGEA